MSVEKRAIKTNRVPMGSAFGSKLRHDPVNIFSPYHLMLADENQFFECLQEILRGLDQQGLNSVFQAWVRRVQEVSEGNGGSIK
jgi:hypothetical protein